MSQPNAGITKTSYPSTMGSIPVTVHKAAERHFGTTTRQSSTNSSEPTSPRSPLFHKEPALCEIVFVIFCFGLIFSSLTTLLIITTQTHFSITFTQKRFHVTNRENNSFQAHEAPTSDSKPECDCPGHTPIGRLQLKDEGNGHVSIKTPDDELYIRMPRANFHHLFGPEGLFQLEEDPDQST